MAMTEIEAKLAAQARTVAITRQNLHGAKAHRITIAATNHYLRAREDLKRLSKLASVRESGERGGR